MSTDTTGLVLVPAVVVDDEPGNVCKGCKFFDESMCPHVDRSSTAENCYGKHGQNFIWIPDTDEGRAAYIALKLTI